MGLKDIVWKLITEPLPPQCNEKLSPYSKARCEREIGHPDFHAGRTPTGIWKFRKVTNA